MSAAPLSAAAIIDRLALQPHPEGGWYREIYRSRQAVLTSAGPRSAFTDIYYLLECGQQSRWHVVDADEAWHFHSGAPLQLYLYEPASGALTERLLHTPGLDREPTAVVPAGAWQAARSLGEFSLVGCSVAPGFEFSGFRFVAHLPDHARHFDPSLREDRRPLPPATSLSMHALRDLL